MGTKISNIEPCGKMVLLKFIEIKDTNLFVMKGSVLVQNEAATDAKKKVYATVSKMGPEVKDVTFKVGDRVFYNDYDCKMFGDDENTWGLTKAESIYASYEEE